LTLGTFRIAPILGAGILVATALPAVATQTDVYIADEGNNRTKAKGTPIVSLTPGVITTVAGNGKYGSSGDGGPATKAELLLAMARPASAATGALPPKPNSMLRTLLPSTPQVTSTSPIKEMTGSARSTPRA
jgi:hypothetical protein